MPTPLHCLCAMSCYMFVVLVCVFSVIISIKLFSVSMKRSRAPNFSDYEVMHLLKLVKKFPIIENKKTDGATTLEKQIAWRALADEYNATTPEGPRTIESLLACYKNQKTRRKHLNSSVKLHSKVSDGDTYPQSSNVMVLAKVEPLSDSSLEALYPYDSEFQCTEQQQDLSPADKELQQVDVLASNASNDSESKTAPKCSTENCDKIEFCTTQIKRNVSAETPASKKLDPLKHNNPVLETHKINHGKEIKTPESFLDETKEFRKIRKMIAIDQLHHQKQMNDLNLKIIKEKLDFEQKTNVMELEFQKKKQEIELAFLRDKYELELNLLRNKQ